MSTTGELRIRIDQRQKEMLENMASAMGYKTLSDFCRHKIFDGDLSVHTKLNQIIQILRTEQSVPIVLRNGDFKHEQKLSSSN